MNANCWNEFEHGGYSSTGGTSKRSVWRRKCSPRAPRGEVFTQSVKATLPPASCMGWPVARLQGRYTRYLVGMLLLSVVYLSEGCTRGYYRRAADDEVNCIIDNKSRAAGIAPGQFRIDIDPRSRMYDPNNPDCPPMPPDDPTSHQLMHCVDCKPGSPCWRHMSRTPYTDNPTWRDYLPRDANGNYVLDLAGAVQMARLQSPDYQQQLETLYLSGLDVTFERFRFDTQFFGDSSIFFTTDGRDRNGPFGNSSSELDVQPFNARATKFTATGGELVVGFANSLMWQFAGPDNYTSNSLLNFNFVQPLLRGGGRIRVMERLTLSERALLANVRQMERYRSGFYLNVVTGRDTGSGPNRRGGFFGGSGLEGFSGVGGGGFGRVGGFEGRFFGGGGGFTGGAGAQGAGGYLGLLQSAQIIRNQYANIAGLRDTVEQLQAANDAGRIDRFQVDLARQAMYNAQSQLLNSVAQYETSLDNFKVQYGLPPDLAVTIADPLLEHFNLLNPELATLQTRVTESLVVLREGEFSGVEIDPEQVMILPQMDNPQAPRELAPEELDRLAAESTQLRQEAERQYKSAVVDLEKLKQAVPTRKAGLLRLSKRAEVQTMELDPDMLSADALDERVASLERDLAQLGERIQSVWQKLDQLATDQSLAPADRREQLTSSLTQLSGELLELALLQAKARLDAITFEPVDISPEDAFCIASRYRLDWMNARAAVVDSWRLIHFNANDLESDLDLVFAGDVGNVGDNPFRFRGTNGRLSAGLQFDGPFTRLAERNVYRQSLIEYQQAKRTYYRFRDNVHRGIRSTLRQLRVDDLNLELRRAAVHVAIAQVDLARLRLSEPARPVAATAPGTPTQPGGQSQFGDTVARDLVNAQIDLLNVQNDFLSVWVDHYVQELQLDFDLGVMQLDPNGMRLSHEQPLRMYLENLPPCAAPFELPDACADAAALRSIGQELRQPEDSSELRFEELKSDDAERPANREPLLLPTDDEETSEDGATEAIPLLPPPGAEG